jgi:hypothetical protein
LTRRRDDRNVQCADTFFSRPNLPRHQRQIDYGFHDLTPIKLGQDQINL